VATTDVPYEPATPLLKAELLDVYAPIRSGRSPVVVMFHADPASLSKDFLREHAQRVADLGFVVFVPAWGDPPTGTSVERGAAPSYESLAAANAEAACAVAFARSHAAEYGGDPATMIVFGHSAGANTAAMVAFARPDPTAGCLGGQALGAIDALVTWEGDWILGAPMWDDVLAVDPRVLEANTPWASIARHPDLRVVMLVSEGTEIGAREVGDPNAAGSFLAVRDPSGALRERLAASGALADGRLGFTESQQLLFSTLKAQGNHVSLDVMPRSTHMQLGDEGWAVFLAAFPKAAAGG
jgi:acetyl esterase/lipase